MKINHTPSDISTEIDNHKNQYFAHQLQLGPEISFLADKSGKINYASFGEKPPTVEEAVDEIIQDSQVVDLLYARLALTAPLKRKGKVVNFSALPDDVLLDIGANAYLPGSNHLMTPAEREMANEHGVPVYFGEKPAHHQMADKPRYEVARPVVFHQC